MVSPTSAVDGPQPLPGGASLHVRVNGNGAALPLLLVENVEPAAALPNALPHRDFSGYAADFWTGSGSMMAVATRRGEERWRTKATGDTGCSAVEVTLGRLFRLTGLTAPQMVLASNVDMLPHDELHVASRFDDRYQDLGQFLTSDVAERVVSGADAARAGRYRELRARHAVAVEACERVLQRAGVERFWQLQRPDLVDEHARQDQARFEALEAMNRMLPADLRCEQLRHYVASTWLDNWDHLNYRMENTGFTVRDGQPRAMTVDFGSCGPLGFRNLRNGVLLPKAASGDIAMVQRPPALFPIPDAYVHRADSFDTGGDDPGALQDTLRWPYGFQSESIVEMLRPPVAADPAVADTLAEMGYRLALLPRTAIDATVQQGWQTPETRTATPWPDADTFVRQLDARRTALLGRYDAAVLAQWVQDNPERAAQVREEMREAVHQAVGPGDAGAPCIDELEQRHRAVSKGVLPGRAPAHAAINGLTREIRSLQSLLGCVQALQHGLLLGDAATSEAAITQLLSPDVFGELMVNADLGPGVRLDTRAAFQANHAWLALVTQLLKTGRVSPARVATVLLAPAQARAYPPAVARSCASHADLGLSFLNLLEEVMSGPDAVPAVQLRAGLLQAKPRGEANFFTVLQGLDDAAAWEARLDSASLWPSSKEMAQIKSLRACLMHRVRHALAQDARPVEPSDEASELQQMTLEPLLGRIVDAYPPQRLAELELPALKERVLARVRWVSQEERAAIRTMAADAVSAAWRKAVGKHPALAGMKVPQDLIETQQQAACNAFEAAMQAHRRPALHALMDSAGRRYVEAVQRDAGMSKAQRGEILDGCVSDVLAGHDALLAASRSSDPTLPGHAALIGQVDERVNSEIGEKTRVQAAAAAELAAQRDAARRSADEAGRAAQVAVGTQARRQAIAEVERAAMVVAYQQSQAAARERTEARAVKETEARAARVSQARTAALEARLKVLQDERRGEETDRMLAARLDNLRQRGRAVAPPTRTAEYLDASGRPRTLNL